MANQKGHLPIQGTIGNLTYYKNDQGYSVRQKTSIDATRIANDPKFQRTRENGQEFACAGKAAKLLRIAFNMILQRIGDKRVIARMVKQMHNALKADLESLRGERTVEKGNVQFLKGFEFNAASKLETTLYAQYVANIDRATGTATVQIPAIRPKQSIAMPKGCTHYLLSIVAAEIDYDSGTFQHATTNSGELLLTEDEQPPLTLSVQLPANSDKHLFLAFSIEFFQLLNDRYYILSNGSYSAMQMVAVNPHD
ncbi:hypothetical protein ACWKWU_03195 [Chitinophaga lutea]